MNKTYTNNQSAYDDRVEQVELIDSAFESLQTVLRTAHDQLQSTILEAADEMYACFRRGGKLLICGNGGSAADAQHLAAELVGRFKASDRVALPALALTADSSVLTAWSNDVDYDETFARQVEAFGTPDDIVIGISTSGRSKNVIAAFREARRRRIGTMGLLGNDGGDMLPLSDISIVVPSDDTQRVQEVQTLIMHLLCELVEERVIKDRLQPHQVHRHTTNGDAGLPNHNEYQTYKNGRTNTRERSLENGR